MLLLLALGAELWGQSAALIKGRVTGGREGQPLFYATVSVHHPADTALLTGVATDTTGAFIFRSLPAGDYLIRFSAVGYTTAWRQVQFPQSGTLDLGPLNLAEQSQRIREVVVQGRLLQARAEGDKILYRLSSEVQEASANGAALLSYIPGVKVGLMQEVSLHGQGRVKLYVDGRERDLSFLRQLETEQIDRLEVSHMPGAGEESGTGGTINIILKEPQQGVSGQLQLEIPTRRSEIYAFPVFRLGYSRKKLNIYTSWAGEFSYFDVSHSQEQMSIAGADEFQSHMRSELRQKNWSHRFHLGADYTLGQKGQLGFYAYFNPYSQEQDGTFEYRQHFRGDSVYATGVKEDEDRNRKGFMSLYYTQPFSGKNHLLEVEADYYRFAAHNEVNLLPDRMQDFDTERLQTIVSPSRRRGELRIRYQRQLAEGLQMEGGLNFRLQRLEDSGEAGFHRESSYAAMYSLLRWQHEHWKLQTGIRMEHRDAQTEGLNARRYLHFLPSALLEYSSESKHAWRLQYAHTVDDPGFYHLYPGTLVSSMHYQHEGNAALRPSARNLLKLEHSFRPWGNHLSWGINYEQTKAYQQKLYAFSEEGLLTSRMENAGRLQEKAVYLSGSWRLGRKLSFSHYTRLRELVSRYDADLEFAPTNPPADLGWETQMAITGRLPKGINLSFRYQYTAAVPRFHQESYEDALYMLEVKKEFSPVMALTATFALPGKQDFVYYGERYSHPEISMHERNVIHFSHIPLWLKFTYSFRSGAKSRLRQTERGKISDGRKKGF